MLLNVESQTQCPEILFKFSTHCNPREFLEFQRTSTLKENIGVHSFSWVKTIPQWHGSVDYMADIPVVLNFFYCKVTMEKCMCACICGGA